MTNLFPLPASVRISSSGPPLLAEAFRVFAMSRAQRGTVIISPLNPPRRPGLEQMPAPCAGPPLAPR